MSISLENAVKKALRYISLAVTPSAILAVTPAHAQDQRDALLEAALKRISALEAKVGKIDTLEQENHQLRSKLGKTQVRREASFSAPAASNQLVAIGGSADEIETMPKTNRWEGFYAGINAGYGANNINVYNSTNSYDKQSGALIEAVTSRTMSYIGGAVAGGQFGYNHVFANHIMLGAEADIDWADVYNNTSPTNTTTNVINVAGNFAPSYLPREIVSNTTSDYSRLGMDWVGTVRARVGYDLGKFLPYVTGGFAYGGLSNSLGNYDYGTEYRIRPTTPLTATVTPEAARTMGNSSTVSFGWALGAGAEFMVADGWSVKGEYLYTSIGGVTMPHYSQSTENNEFKTFVSEHTGSIGVHQARVGLNYHPGWSFGETLISAKY
jgi:outer membrane immunogenic protein